MYCQDFVDGALTACAAGQSGGPLGPTMAGPIQVYGSDELVKWCAFVFVFAWTAGPNCESTK